MKRTTALLLALLILAGCAATSGGRRLDQPQGQTLTAAVGSRLFRLERPSMDLSKPSALEVYWQGVAPDGESLLRVRDLNASQTAYPSAAQWKAIDPSEHCRALVWVKSSDGRMGDRPKDDIFDSVSRWSAAIRCMEFGGILVRLREVGPDNLQFEVEDLQIATPSN